MSWATSVPRELNSALRKAEWQDRRIRALRRNGISMAYLPERREEAARKMKERMADPEFRAKQEAGRDRFNAANKDKCAQSLVNFRRSPDHPLPVLPPMNKKERARYNYLRFGKKMARNDALWLVMNERKVNDAYETNASEG